MLPVIVSSMKGLIFWTRKLYFFEVLAQNLQRNDSMTRIHGSKRSKSSCLVSRIKVHFFTLLSRKEKVVLIVLTFFSFFFSLFFFQVPVETFNAYLSFNASLFFMEIVLTFNDHLWFHFVGQSCFKTRNLRDPFNFLCFLRLMVWRERVQQTFMKPGQRI